MSEQELDDSSPVWTTNWLRFLKAEIKVAPKACRLAGISTRTLCVLAFELTSTLTSSDGPGDKSVGKLTKNERADVWLHIDMCTKGPDVLEEIIDSVYPPCPWGAGIMQWDILSRMWQILTWSVTISDLAIFNFPFTIRRGLWGVTYVADTWLLMIRPGGSHMTPPVSYWLDHITSHRWLPPSTLLWLSTRRIYVYFLTVLPRYISQACWVASSPRLDFFRCTTVLW